MASYDVNNDIVGGGYGFGGGGGMFAMVILLVVVFWVLFRGDGHKDGYGGGYGMPYGFGGGCGPCVQPTFKDESNWEQEYHLCKEIGLVDKDVWKTACETQKEVHCEGEKTRQLIEQNYIQDLRDQLSEKNAMIQTMKSEAFTAAQIGMVNNKIEKVDEMIERLACELPKRPPVWSECVTPCSVELPERRAARRERCDFDDFRCA